MAPGWAGVRGSCGVRTESSRLNFQQARASKTEDEKRAQHAASVWPGGRIIRWLKNQFGYAWAVANEQSVWREQCQKLIIIELAKDMRQSPRRYCFDRTDG